MTVRFARISSPGWAVVCRLAYTPLASKAAACAGLRMVVPVMGDSKLVLVALLNRNGKKTSPGAPVPRCGLQAGDGGVLLAGACMVLINEPVAAVVMAGISWAPAGAAASLVEWACAVKRPVASKRAEKRLAMRNVVKGAALGNAMAGHPGGGAPQCFETVIREGGG